MGVPAAAASIDGPGAGTAGEGWASGAVARSLASNVASLRLWRAVGAAVVVISTAGAVLFTLTHRDLLPDVALTLAVLATAPLVLLRRRPFPAVGIVVVANGVFVVCSRLPWSPPAVLGWLVALTACPLVLSRRRSLGMLVGSELVVVVGAWMPSSVNARPWDAPITEALAALLVWGAAETFRSRREADLARAEVAAKLLELQGREAVARGRAAIARELHDVVAHQVSLIAVRAAMAPYQVEDLSPAAQEVLSEIAAQARTALDELRTVLGVLRTPDGVVAQAPQPGLADLPALVERSRASGLRVEADFPRPAVSIPGSVELCCYRVAQEGLTNAARHAPGAAVQIRLSYGAHVEVLITNTLATGQSPGDIGADGRDGFGLIGMRERVAALGGDLDAGRDGTLFRLCARIPISAPGPDRD